MRKSGYPTVSFLDILYLKISSHYKLMDSRRPWNEGNTWNTCWLTKINELRLLFSICASSHYFLSWWMNDTWFWEMFYLCLWRQNQVSISICCAWTLPNPKHSVTTYNIQLTEDYTMVDVRIKRILKELIRALYIIQGHQKFQYVSLQIQRTDSMWTSLPYVVWQKCNIIFIIMISSAYI